VFLKRNTHQGPMKDAKTRAAARQMEYQSRVSFLPMRQSDYIGESARAYEFACDQKNYIFYIKN
jgi:hypothetical protein